MTNAYRDENSIPTLITTSKNDGVTIVRIQANPTTHSLKVEDNTTGTDYGQGNAMKDENNIPVLLAVSSADGFTPVEVYGDPVTGAILVDSN